MIFNVNLPKTLCKNFYCILTIFMTNVVLDFILKITLNSNENVNFFFLYSFKILIKDRIYAYFIIYCVFVEK
jgi:hypothetical protein